LIDFNRRSRLPDRINWLVDDGLRGAPEHPRQYLGMSAVGGECERAVQLDGLASAFREQAPACLGESLAQKLFAVRPDPRVMRIFERGHLLEDAAAKWVRGAGFVLNARDPDTGRQYAAELCGGRLKGHADGVIVWWDGQGPCPIELPSLWECKVLGHKWVQKLKKEGVRKTYPKYYGQVCLYMHALGLERCLLTAVDADLMELHHELVQFDLEEAKRLEERFDRIERACMAGELLPREETTRAAFMCRWCRAADVCWEAGGASWQ